MRFADMTPVERTRAERYLREWCARPKHRNTVPGTRKFWYLVGAAARAARHGPPPTYNQRLGYRTAKRNRARAEAKRMYGDPKSDSPTPALSIYPPAKKH